MKHLRFLFIFAGVIGTHLLLQKFPSDEGWKMVKASYASASLAEQPVIHYASLGPEIRQLKWRCVSGELRIRRIQIRTKGGEERSYTFAPELLQAGHTTRPLDLSNVHGDLASVSLWYDSSASTIQPARLEMLSSGMVTLAP